jgi:gentisate 1,2-dioxygenase
MMSDTRQPSRRPLTAAQLRALYEAAPSPQLAAALWEIKRLREAVLKAFLDFERGVQLPGSQAAANVCYFSNVGLQGEPCVVEHLEMEWLKRATPGSRYFAQRDLPVRPAHDPNLHSDEQFPGNDYPIKPLEA